MHLSCVVLLGFNNPRPSFYPYMRGAQPRAQKLPDFPGRHRELSSVAWFPVPACKSLSLGKSVTTALSGLPILEAASEPLGKSLSSLCPSFSIMREKHLTVTTFHFQDCLLWHQQSCETSGTN